jgi:enoyl-CoA hydratase
MKKPVIAAINGFALGGGLELALSCHIRIASNNARMGLPETSLGVIPGYGGTQRLAQIIGKGRAMELILSCKMLNAEEAFSFGLVSQVVTQEELLSTASELAQKILKNSPFAIGQAIKSINAAYDEHQNGFEVEINAFGICFGSEDFKEGTQAFLEKRKANFSGN